MKADNQITSRRKPSKLWLWFLVAFVIQCAAWITWLVIASKNRVQEVPLVRSAL